MTTLHETPEKTTPKRPDPSPLLQWWTRHPQHITDAIIDASPSIEQGRQLRRDLDACARGDIDPDVPGLRMAWAYLGLAGAHGLLDRQRAWHREQAAGGEA